MKALILVAIGFGALAALAQFPGAGGPLGGQYPGGGYPNGGQIPGGRRQPQQSPQDPSSNQGKDSRDKSRNDSRSKATAGTTTEGKLRRVTSGQLVIEPDDHRIIWYRVNARTVTQKNGKDADVTSFVPGDRVSVDSTEDDQGFFTAVEVRWESAGSAADRASARQTWDLPNPAEAAPQEKASSKGTAARRDPGDDRPVLRRKNSDAPAASPTPKDVPAEEEQVDNRPTTEVRQVGDTARDADDPGRPKLKRGAPPPAPPDPAITNSAPQGNRPRPPENPPAQEDPLIAKAREVGASYADSLPNFFVQQMTTRYQSDNPRRGWDALDIVTADVAYQDGKESYKNIKVGNKAVNKPMEDIDGSRSTGEFSTLMEAILRPGNGATFQRNGDDQIRNRSAVVFKFEIPRERSDWRVAQVTQLYYPAFRGSIWIDKETSRVLRIEQEARGLPSLFPLDTVETSTDYDFVRLAVGKEFLLPVEAEVLSCERGTSSCTRNKIEFRNYRKFAADSEVTFGDPAK